MFKDYSHRTRLAPLARFVYGITVAVQRGTQLTDVLCAQAADVRDLAKRDLMESAGNEEIAMMVPNKMRPVLLLPSRHGVRTACG